MFYCNKELFENEKQMFNLEGYNFSNINKRVEVEYKNIKFYCKTVS